MLTGNDTRRKYLEFFKKRGHVVIPSAPLVPENDPTTLFTGSGMQPMLPYLLGETHLLGTRLVDAQKCFRGQDIEEVGDNRHDTFFEMLGNWSLGDYFKSEQLAWFYEFVTRELGLGKEKLHVSVFEGDEQIPRDEETVELWKKLGIRGDHIHYYGETKNWWSRAGIKDNMPVGEPGGPDSEVFYDFDTPHDKRYGDHCHPNCDCGRFMEIGNNVFMTYKKTSSGFVPLEKKNIDFGGGLERLAAASCGVPDIFQTDLYRLTIKQIETDTGEKYGGKSDAAMRIIADHMKAAVFLINDGVRPSNKSQGYFLRRLLRRSMVKMQSLKGDITSPIDDLSYIAIAGSVIKTYAGTDYFVNTNKDEIFSVIAEERDRFGRTLKFGLKELGKADPFDLFQTFGFPPEVTEELLKQRGIQMDWDEFNKKQTEHQDLSRTASKGMFKGGLQDRSEMTTKYHTATHLLHAALRQVLGPHVQQKGSNITGERLRFDFSHPDKLTLAQIRQVEELVNQKVIEDIPVIKTEMTKTQALTEGALAFFPEKYSEVTSVYQIGGFSKELCGGPHVGSTGEIGSIKITREESAGFGVRRIYAS